MKIESPGLFITSAVASVVVVSAAVAMYVSAASNTVASAPVTALDLSSPKVVQAAMEFDPFDFGNVVPEAGPRPEAGDALLASVSRQPTDPPAAGGENAPKADPSGERVPTDDKTKTASSRQTAAQKGDINAVKTTAKTTGKMKLGLGAAVAGGVAVVGVSAVALRITLSDDSKTVVRSPSTP